jgi:FAD synthetase
MVKSLKAVDGAILGGKGGDIYLIMKKLKPDILTIGPDQDFDVNDVQMGLKRAGLKTKVVKINNYWDAGLHSSRIIVDLIKRQ